MSHQRRPDVLRCDIWEQSFAPRPALTCRASAGARAHSYTGQRSENALQSSHLSPAACKAGRILTCETTTPPCPGPDPTAHSP